MGCVGSKTTQSTVNIIQQKHNMTTFIFEDSSHYHTNNGGRRRLFQTLNFLNLEPSETPPTTIGLNFKRISIGNKDFALLDLELELEMKSTLKLCKICRLLSKNIGIIFVVDSNNPESISARSIQLNGILKLRGELVEQHIDVPLLIIATNQCLPNAMTLEEIRIGLNLKSVSGKHYFILPLNDFNDLRLFTGFKWLKDYTSGFQNVIMNKRN